MSSFDKLLAEANCQVGLAVFWPTAWIASIMQHSQNMNEITPYHINFNRTDKQTPAALPL
jgi:hypothetical protein